MLVCINGVKNEDIILTIDKLCDILTSQDCSVAVSDVIGSFCNADNKFAENIRGGKGIKLLNTVVTTQDYDFNDGYDTLSTTDVVIVPKAGIQFMYYTLMSGIEDPLKFMDVVQIKYDKLFSDNKVMSNQVLNYVLMDKWADFIDDDAIFSNARQLGSGSAKAYKLMITAERNRYMRGLVDIIEEGYVYSSYLEHFEVFDEEIEKPLPDDFADKLAINRARHIYRDIVKAFNFR